MIGFSIAEKVVDWLQPAFDTAGYAIIAAAVVAERSIFVGLIVPGDLILALGGVYAAQGRLNLELVILIGIAAAVCGESLGYAIGRRYGVRVIRHIPLVNRLVPRLEHAQEYFDRHGGKTVAIGRYATAAGAFVPFTAGVARMGYRRFLLYDVPAIAVWAAGITVFGYAFGRNLAFIDKVLSRFGYVVLGLAVGFFVTRYVVKRIRGRRDS